MRKIKLLAKEAEGLEDEDQEENAEYDGFPQV